MHILAYMYICIYFTCTRNLFKLQPLLDWFQCRQLVDAFQIWQLTMRFRGNVMGEERQCRDKTQSQENETECVFPHVLHFLLIPMFRTIETDEPGCVALESEFSTQRSLGSSCGSAQNGYIQKRGTRDDTSVSKHTSSASQQVTATTCTVGDSSLTVSY